MKTRTLAVFAAVAIFATIAMLAAFPLQRAIPIKGVSTGAKAEGMDSALIDHMRFGSDDRPWLQAYGAGTATTILLDREHIVTSVFVKNTLHESLGFGAARIRLSSGGTLYEGAAGGGKGFVHIPLKMKSPSERIGLEILEPEGGGAGLSEIALTGAPARGRSVTAIVFIACLIGLLAAWAQAGADKGALIRRAAVGVLLALSVLYSVKLIAFVPGWPNNHEHLVWRDTVLVYARSLSSGVLIPRWLITGPEDLGTPMPLFYHKLFYYAASSIHLAGGSIKFSAMATISAFLFAGALGVYMTSRELGAGVAVSALVGACFPHMNYAVTDWAVRGALAELAAFGLVPWALWWCVRLIGQRRFDYFIGPLMALIVLAHSVIAVFGAAMAAAAVLYSWLAHGRPREYVLRSLASAAIAAALLAPFVLPMLKAWGLFSMSTASEGIFSPLNQFAPIARYFHDPDAWGARYDAYSIQIDTPLLVGLMAGAVALLLARRGRNAGGSMSGAGWFMAGIIAVCMFMQLPASGLIYEHVPLVGSVQFPWRLLIFILTALLGLVALVLGSLSAVSGRASGVMALAVFVFMAAWSPATRPFGYAYYSAALVESTIEPERADWWEYFPRIDFDNGREMTRREAKGDYMARLARRGPELVDGNGACTVEALAPGHLVRSYRVTCASDSVLALPHTYSSLENVELIGTDGSAMSTLPASRTPSDPRIRITAPAGEHVLRLRLPAGLRLWGG